MDFTSGFQRNFGARGKKGYLKGKNDEMRACGWKLKGKEREGALSVITSSGDRTGSGGA